MWKKKCWLLCILAACNSPSEREIRLQGEAETRKLALLFSEITTKEQLQKRMPSIQSSYGKIADLMIQLKHLEGGFTPEEEPSEASVALYGELTRLYEMPGFRYLLEKAQEGAVERLKTASIAP